jgi:hypothetical protein
MNSHQNNKMSMFRAADVVIPRHQKTIDAMPPMAEAVTESRRSIPDLLQRGMIKRLVSFLSIVTTLLLVVCSSYEKETLVLDGKWRIKNMFCTVAWSDHVRKTVPCTLIDSLCEMNFSEDRYTLMYSAKACLYPYDTLSSIELSQLYNEYRDLVANNGDQYSIDSLGRIIYRTPTAQPIKKIYFSMNETGNYSAEYEFLEGALFEPSYFLGTIKFSPENAAQWSTSFKCYKGIDHVPSSIELESVPDSLTIYIELGIIQ